MDKLLEILRENSSFTTKELSLMLGEPEDYITAQIKEYEQTGVIKGYQAIIDFDKVPDAGVTAIIDLKVTPERETGFDSIATKIMSFEEVRTLYLMAGSYDFAVIVNGETMQDVASFVARKISCVDGVVATATHFMLKTYKLGGVSLVDEDSTDRRSMVL
ncbi:MAG: Lrp/AsnC family transcriptional regulator [Ruminococcus sp.]|nr:Lrp/AsnC family transcriptional regulator [Ruminococcus sp.]